MLELYRRYYVVSPQYVGKYLDRYLLLILMYSSMYYQAHFTANIFDILKNRYFNVSEKVTSLEKRHFSP